MAAFTPPLSTRRALLSATAYAVLALAVGPVAAQDAAYPAKPIRFIVPYAPGGTTDLVARTVGAHMAQSLGQPVIIDNRAGAGGNIGMDAVAKAAPDGYTVGMGAISTDALNPHIYKKMPFDPRKDFTSVGLLAAGFTPRSASVADFDAQTKREYERLGKIARSAQMNAD